jgi:hypothetical protein
MSVLTTVVTILESEKYYDEPEVRQKAIALLNAVDSDLNSLDYLQSSDTDRAAEQMLLALDEVEDFDDVVDTDDEDEMEIEDADDEEDEFEYEEYEEDDDNEEDDDEDALGGDEEDVRAD